MGNKVPVMGHTMSSSEMTVSIVVFHSGGGRADAIAPVAHNKQPKASGVIRSSANDATELFTRSGCSTLPVV